MKHGIRLDGSFIGYMMGKRDHPHQGTVHHNVVWNAQDIYVKGDEHQVYNNLAFDNSNNDLAIRSRVGQPTPKDVLEGYDYTLGWVPGADHPLENDKSIIRNNLAGKISSSKTKNTIGLPGRHSNNLETDVREQLRDPDNLDFRPKKDARVVDAGYYVDGVNDNYVGETYTIQGSWNQVKHTIGGSTLSWTSGSSRALSGNLLWNMNQGPKMKSRSSHWWTGFEW